LVGLAHRRRTPPGVELTIKYEGVRHTFAADKDRGDRAAWLASGSNRTFEEWKADRDAEALALAKVNQEALIAETEAKRLEVEGRKAEAEARRAQKALAKAKDFVKEMYDDHAKSLKSRASIVLGDMSGLDQIATDMAKHLEAKIEALMKNRPKAKIIKLENVASNSLKSAYLYYRQLSADSAHTSVGTLKRHIRRRGDEFSIALEYSGSVEREAAKAVDVASNAAMGVCISATQLLGGSEADDLLRQLWNQYRALADSKGALVAFR
jgi:hypothetical protein